MTWIMGIDPGGVTGYALWQNGKIVADWTGQQEPYPFLVDAHLWIRNAPDDGYLVVERYTITAATAKKSQQPEALEQIGALRYLAKSERGWDLHMQMPSQAMTLIPDARLKALGWYIPGEAGKHANDALRHVAFFAAKNTLLDLPVVG